MAFVTPNEAVPTIIVVDDNRDIRLMVSDVLKNIGINALPVKCAKDALVTIAGLATLPNLVISDITMPDMTGLEMCCIIEDRYPDLPVLIMTGAPEAYAECVDLMRGGRLLKKPFRIAELLERVGAILSDGTAGEELYFV